MSWKDKAKNLYDVTGNVTVLYLKIISTDQSETG